MMSETSIIKEKILHKGAEAYLYLGTWFGKKVIFKQRIPKRYRTIELDYQIRSKRTINEARALIKAKNYGINVPIVYEIEPNTATIVMQYIEGEKLKDLMTKMNEEKKIEIFRTLGKYIAILHDNGHIHGDITTSNIIVTRNQNIVLIDFGLHENSETIEDKSVDLHLFKRVLISSHGEDYKICYEAFLEGYISQYDDDKKNLCEEIIENINIVESRGRYVKQEDRK